jgi:hypothetical protein
VAYDRLRRRLDSLVGERRGEAGGRVQGLGDPEELRRVQASSADGPVHPRPDVLRSPDAEAGTLLQQGSRLVRLIEHPGDHDVVRGWLQPIGESVRRGERGGRGEARADQRELQQGLRADVHQATAFLNVPGRRTGVP